METIKLLIKGLITNLIFTTILFICAGRINYIQGWVFLCVNVGTTLMNFLTSQNKKDLVNERSKLGEGVKDWDKLLLGLSAVMYLILIIIAGLDSGRYFWTKDFSWEIVISGIAMIFTGQILFLTARSQNNYFSIVVRIQKEREHVVCDTGLYKYIRHPGYLGMILSLIGIPLITTSIFSSIPTSMAIILLLIRTFLEDKTLKAELNGYTEYSERTRYKLLPFIW